MNQKIDFIGIIFFIAGVLFLARNIIYYFKPQSLKNYIEKSLKAQIWKNKFGMEKTIKLSKFVFLPLGIIVSIGFILFGFLSGILPLIQ